MLLDECRLPVVLAPLAGGPSTPELCAAVSEAGGLGFLAAGYLAAAELAARIDRTRELTARPFGVNLFVPTTGGNPAAVQAYARRLEPEARKAGGTARRASRRRRRLAGKARGSDRLPRAARVVHVRLPPTDVIARLQRLGSEVWVTLTSLEEAHLAVSAGADGLVVQGLEAGGHRGGFTDSRSQRH